MIRHLCATFAAALVAAAFSSPARAGTCYIDGNVQYQVMDGIGFSSAWCGTLTNAKNAALYDTLGFSLLRIRIDQNNNWAEETANSAAAHARGLKVLGSCWSGPVQWNSNGQSTGGYLLPQYYANYASWLGQAANTIQLDWVSFQNEPDIGDGAIAWTPAQLLTFLKNNSSAIGRPICYAESFCYDDSYTDPALNDSAAVGKIAVVGGHIYGAGNYKHTNALNKGKKTWMTEHYIANSRDNMANCAILAKEIVDCMHNWMSAYFFWWVYDADASVNLVHQNGTIYKAGYTGGQFAKWIRPGKVRIGTSYNPSTNVYTTAFRNGGVVVVAVNTGTSSVSQPFYFSNISGLSSMIVHRTSANENMAGVGNVTLSNNGFTYTLPPQSVTTFHQF